jgi:hypothetical protein
MFNLFKTSEPVPPFKQYLASEQNMDTQQRRFYSCWLDSWRRGKALDVQGNISYLFCYVYSVLAWPPQKAVPELERLAQSYPQDEKFTEYCRAWLSDCCVLTGDYRRALQVYPPIPISTRGATCTDDILSLKLLIGEHIAGRDILTLNGPKVTNWGKVHLDQVAAYLDIILSSYERNNNGNLLVLWSKTSHQYPYAVFRGTYLSSAASVPAFYFSHNDTAMEFVREMTRDAENSVRDEMNIPKVGEGWISETNLYYEIRTALGGVEVTHHARPEWLGKQHLDILVPSLSVALEFQGPQHDEPIEYFGGEEAFRVTRARDARKKRLCIKNGIRLIDVRPGYELNSLIAMIRDVKNQEEQERHPTRESL